MSGKARLRQPVWGSILLLTLAFCGAGRGQSQTAPQPVRSNAPAADAANAAVHDDQLYAQLWMSASPEYKAICLQTFNAALEHVARQAAAAPRAEGVPVGARAKPMAVVVDLDETILDNSGFQIQLILTGSQFSPADWERWVRQKTGVRLVPGAGRFIQGVEALGVTMVYLSNRSAESGQATIETLQMLGVNVAGLGDAATRRLLLKTDSSDKEARRRLAAEAYDIVAFLGDSLGDFPEIVGADNQQRNQRVEVYREMLGARWFVLPNPTYGDWTKSFGAAGPRQYLRQIYEARQPPPR